MHALNSIQDDSESETLRVYNKRKIKSKRLKNIGQIRYSEGL